VPGMGVDRDMEKTSILLVDDEPHILRALRHSLTGENVRLFEASTAEEAVAAAAARRPDLIILDLGLPDRPGQWVCREIRKWSHAPIIVLSAHLGEREKVELLDLGADDYVTKPFSPEELKARIRAQLRRARLTDLPSGDGVFRVGKLAIDPGARTVRRDGENIHLTPTEWELLRVFLRSPGKTLTHHRLFNAVWAASSGDPKQYLRVYVANLRRKLEPDPLRPSLIITEPGVGYRLEIHD